MFVKKIFTALLLFVTTFSFAKKFDFNENCRIAYNEIIALKLNEGAALLKEEEFKYPENLIPVYLENYVDFLTVYTTDSRPVYEQLKKKKENRLDQLESGDQGSPYYLFTQAEVNLQWAALNIKFGDYLSALFAIHRAYKLLEQNRKLFPSFSANEKSLGVLYTLLGSVPDKYKWGLNLLGMEGNVERGMNYLNNLVEYGKTNDFIYREETVTYYAFLLLNLQNDGDSAWKVLLDNGFPLKDNLMNVYACAHIGIYGTHNEEALKILAERPVSDTFAQFPFLVYLTGLAHLNSLDSDAASYFKKFVVEYKGDNHIKSAFQKIAWGYLLLGDTTNYLYFIEKIKRLGASTLDADKQAKKEAESCQIPDPRLLRARLLFDGGYYQRAADEIKRFSEKDFKTIEERTEYLYRLARIYQAQGKNDSAIGYYSMAIESGKNLTRYFAANSALEGGKIYETQGDKEKAKYYFHLCLSFNNHEYKDGLDQKAKAELNRLK